MAFNGKIMWRPIFHFSITFKWKDIFRPLVAYILQLAKDTRTYRHYVYDLVYLDYRYNGQQNYSFSYALVEYRHMMDRLHYVDTLFNDKFIHLQIQLLKEGLALEIQRAQTGYLYRSCSCGSSIVSPEEFAAKTSH